MGKKGAKGKGKEDAGPQRKLVVLSTDMPQAMQDKIVAVANESMTTSKIEKDIATGIKKKADEQLGGTWHCICGKDFGASLCFEAKCSFFFKLDEHFLLAFKSQE